MKGRGEAGSEPVGLGGCTEWVGVCVWGGGEGGGSASIRGWEDAACWS